MADMRRSSLLLGLVVGLVAHNHLAQGQVQAQLTEPILRIETGMHGDMINRVTAVDQGQELITVSDDKTTRLWSLSDGGARAVWRTPIGEGDSGALFAVAAAGDTVVVGGRTDGASRKGAALYAIDRRTGQMRGSIAGFTEAISALAFSTDGRYLAVGQQGRGGLALIDFPARRLAAQDRTYAGTIEWISFSADGRLATSSADGKLRLYDRALKLAAEASLPGDGTAADRPWGLAFSPDGESLAVGTLNSAKVRLFASDGLTHLETVEGGLRKAGALSVVGWSADGSVLAAAGSYKDSSGRRLIRFWHVHGKDIAPGEDVGVARDTVTDLAFLPDGRAVYASAEPSWGVVDPNGKETVHRGPEHADFRDAWQNAFRVSRDGAIVDFPSEQGYKSRFRFDLLEGSLSLDPAPREDIRRPVVEDAHLKVAGWRNGTAPTLNGRTIALQTNEHVRSVAVLPAAESVALGTDFYLRLERLTGEAWRQEVPAPAWSVNVSADGRYVLAALGDGTIRWYASGDGREVMSLFVDPHDRRWAVWVPEGFFDHSQETHGRGGETLVGYHLNNGDDKAADFVAIGQLYNLFYRRDLVLAKFRGGGDGERMVANQLTRIGDVRVVLRTGVPPHLQLIEACLRPAGSFGCTRETTIDRIDPVDRKLSLSGAGGELFARYSIEDRGGGLGRVVIRRNGAVIGSPPTVEEFDAHRRTETVVLPMYAAGDEIRFATESGNGAIQSSEQDDVVVKINPASSNVAPEPAPASGQAELFAVAIGISQYQVPEFQLDNAANDARAVGDLLNKPSQPVYSEAHVTILLDRDATASNIKQSLDRVAAQARIQDIVVIFFSGHGASVDGKYFFAPVDFAARYLERIEEAKKANESRRAEIIDDLFRRDGFGEAQLLPLLEKIQGNLLLVLDTCYSATFAISDAVEQKARNETVVRSVGHEIGRFILAGARNLALDSNGGDVTTEAGGHGLFTTHLLKGLNGAADLQHVGRINVAELLMFTKSTVREESRKLNLDQEPFYYFAGSNFFDVRAVAVNP